MSLRDDLERRTHSIAWKLEIDGFKTRFTSCEPGGGVSSPHDWAEAIVSTSAVDSELDTLGGIVESGGMTIRLAITRTNGVEALLRSQPRGCERRATLAITLPQSTAGGVVRVHEDISGWPASGELWVGSECIHYSSRTVVAPFEFTYPAGAGTGRGYYGSQINEHLVDEFHGWAPPVTDACWSWRGRRARIRVSTKLSTGVSDTSWWDEVAGFVDVSPALSDDGLTVELAIVPHTALLEREVGGDQATTGLQHDWHCFDGETGHQVRVTQGWETGKVVRTAGDMTLAGVAILATKWIEHEDCFDVAEPARAAHWGWIEINADPGRFRPDPVPAVAYVGAAHGGTFNLDAAYPHAALGVVGWRSSFAQTTYLYDLTPAGTPAAFRWPGEATEAITANWTPGTIKAATAPVGTQSMWCDVRILDQGGWHMFVRSNPQTKMGDPFVKLSMTAGGAGLWYGLSWQDPDDNTRPRPLDRLPVDQRRTWQRQPLPVTATLQPIGVDVEGDYNAIPIRGAAQAYYQTGEKWIHVERDVFPPAPFSVIIRWNEQGAEHRTMTRISAKAQASATFGGVPGYLLEVDAAYRGVTESFGDWRGEDPASVTTAVQRRGIPPNYLMLQLLMSGRGAGFNHATYDSLPLGLNLTTDEVDVLSFESFPLDGLSASGLSYEVDEARSVRDVFTPLLTTMGASLVLRVDPATGRRKLALEPAGVAVGINSAKTIANGDWISDGRPSTSTDDRIQNALTLQLNYDWTEREHRLEVHVNDRDSMSAFGGEVKPVEVDLRGVSLPAASPTAHVAAMLPVAQRRFAITAHPRRRLAGSIAWSDAALLDPGSVVKVSAADARNLDGSQGVVSQAARVVRLRRDAQTQTADIEVEVHEVNATGWAPSLDVTNVVNATVVDVAPNAYSDTEHHVTGATQADVDFFAIGDAILCIPHGDYAAATATTIANIVGNQITLGAAHGMAVGPGAASIEPGSYDLASAAHQAYAYLADDSETLGAAGDPAYEYA